MCMGISKFESVTMPPLLCEWALVLNSTVFERHSIQKRGLKSSAACLCFVWKIFLILTVKVLTVHATWYHCGQFTSLLATCCRSSLGTDVEQLSLTLLKRHECSLLNNLTEYGYSGNSLSSVLTCTMLPAPPSAAQWWNEHWAIRIWDAQKLAWDWAIRWLAACLCQYVRLNNIASTAANSECLHAYDVWYGWSLAMFHWKRSCTKSSVFIPAEGYYWSGQLLYSCHRVVITCNHRYYLCCNLRIRFRIPCIMGSNRGLILSVYTSWCHSLQEIQVTVTETPIFTRSKIAD